MDRNGSKWNKNELILHILKYFVNQEFSLSSNVKWMRLSLLTQSEEQAASAKKNIHFAYAEWEIASALHGPRHTKGPNQLKWELNTELAYEKKDLPKGRNNSPLYHLSQSWTLKWSDRLVRPVLWVCPTWNKRATFIRERVSLLVQWTHACSFSLVCLLPLLSLPSIL